MSDLAIKNACAKRDMLASRINQLNQQVHDLRAELKAVDEWIAGWHQFAGTPSADSEIPHWAEEHSKNDESTRGSESVDNHLPERTRTTGNPKKEVVAAAARRIIEAAGQPLSRADLYKALSREGIQIEGKDPEQVLSTMLWRMREVEGIIRLRSGGYWLEEQQDSLNENEKEQEENKVDLESIEATYRDPFDQRAFLTNQRDILQQKIADADRHHESEDAPSMSDAEYDTILRKIDYLNSRINGKI